MAWFHASIPQEEYEACFYRLISRRIFAPAGSYLVPVVGKLDECLAVRHCRSRLRGVNPGHLQPLSRVVSVANRVQASTRCALVNARSVMNKSFILKDFFNTHSLDLFFITETWINLGESTAFSEL